jgi:peptidyl-prolyl cis-trans isomerase D
MSIIQKIQEKYAKVMAIIIAIALIVFVIMLAFENGGTLFSGDQTTVGTVNGKAIEYQAFSARVANIEKYQQDQGQNVNDASRQQIIQSVWDQQVNDIVLEEKYKEVGLTVTEKELRDILYGNNPPQDLAQQFTDPQTGQYKAVQAQQYISSVKTQGTPQDQDRVNQYLEALEKDRMMEKYMSLLTNSIHFSKWFLEKRNIDNSLMANAAFVSIPYATIADSTVTVSDKEIEDYIKANKNDFEQKEETRNIEYVTFSAAPSGADSAATYDAVLALKPTFDTLNSDYELFLSRNSFMPYYDGYVSRSAIQQVNKDSILSAPTGVVYGPYLDPGQQTAYSMSKIIASRTLPDTVKVRHILVATHQMSQTGDRMPVREEQEASRIADSIMKAHRAGASFDTLVAMHSDDPGSKDKGGVYEGITTGRMVAPFNDFVFTNSRGTTGIVKTEFGFHYIEILEQKGSSPAYKVAYLSKPIQASQETDNNAQNAASMFAGESRDYKSFLSNYDKNLKAQGINKFPASDIKPLDFSIAGMEAPSRKLVRDIFEADKGDIVGPERVGESYVVGVVTEVNKAGLANVSRVRPMIEPILRNKKKAQQIIQQLGQVTDLEQVATKFNTQVQPMDSVRFSGGNNMLAYEPKVIGAIFNPENKGKVSKPIAGQAGVYVIRVTDVSTVPVENASIEDQRRSLVMQTRQSLQSQMQYGGGNPYIDVLKKNAKVEDRRSNFY